MANSATSQALGLGLAAAAKKEQTEHVFKTNTALPVGLPPE
jgi:hypothetical protein